MWAFTLALPQAAHADERVQRVVPPEIVIPGLERAVIVQSGDVLSNHLQVGIGNAFRIQIGWTDGVPAPATGLSTQRFDYTMVPGPPGLGAQDVINLAVPNDAQAVVLASGSVHQLAWKEWKAIRKVNKTVNGRTTSETWTVPCASRTVILTFDYSIYDGLTGGLLKGDKFSFPSISSDCQERGGDSLVIATADELFINATASVGVSIAENFLLKWDPITLDTQRDAATKHTLVHLKEDNFTAFIDATSAVLDEDPYNPIAMLNLAAAVEATGHLAEANVLFQYAEHLKASQVTRKALERIEARAAQRSVLRDAYGLDVTQPYPGVVQGWLATASRGVATPVLGEPGTVKGAKNKRAPVLDGPDGAEMVQVPGGTSLRVITEEGDLVHVQLPDGREGWMEAKAVKS